MMRLKTDLFERADGTPTDGTLDQVELQWDRRVALGVVMAAPATRLTPRKGDAITGLPRRGADDAMVFHAGTALQDGERRHHRRPRAVRDRARRLGASWRSSAPTRSLRGIRFDGAQYRSDIGHRAIKR